jgi:hypothetical protein
MYQSNASLNEAGCVGEVVIHMYESVLMLAMPAAVHLLACDAR